jgi:xanthine dehydrogenase accessory factor
MTDWPFAPLRIAIRGGGDLGSGVAYRLRRAGFPVLIAELARPLLVRRTVCFGSAVIEGQITVDGLTGCHVETLDDATAEQSAGNIPVAVDPDGVLLAAYAPAVLIDARMLKRDPSPQPVDAPLIIGLGPGFVAPDNCHAVIETNRGHNLGRVIWQGAAEPDTAQPGQMMGRTFERVLRAPTDGILTGIARIGTPLHAGDPVAQIGAETLHASFDGVLRGLIHDGSSVQKGLKVGDLDPRADPGFVFSISDKALAIGGGVVEAVLASPLIRQMVNASV